MPWNILRFYILYNKIRDLWTWMFIQIHMEHHSYTGISSLVLLHLVTNPTTTPPPAFLTLFTRSSVLGLRGSGPPSPWLVSFSLMLRSVKTLASVGWDQSGSADHFMYHSTPHPPPLLAQSDGKTQWMSNDLRWCLYYELYTDGSDGDIQPVDRDRRVCVETYPLSDHFLLFWVVFFSITTSLSIPSHKLSSMRWFP